MLLFFVAFLIPLESYAVSGCDADGLHYQCLGDQKCIPLDWLCDGRSDCLNGDDEQGQVCEPRGARRKIFERGNCGPLQFECEDSSGERKCILEKWRCDRHVDCKNGMDEEGCDYSAIKSEPPPRLLNLFNFAHQTNCSDGQFLCTLIKECLSNRSMVCDGRKDCRDGTDEQNCDGAASQKTPKTSQQSTQQSTHNQETNERTQSNRLSTPILPLLSQKSTGTFFHNLSTLLAQAQTKSTNEKNPEPTAQTSLTKAVQARVVGRGSTEAVLPISPNYVDPVSASANKPERVTIHRIEHKTSATNPTTSAHRAEINSQVRSSTMNAITLEVPRIAAKRAQVPNIFLQFQPLGNYGPIIPQL